MKQKNGWISKIFERLIMAVFVSVCLTAAASAELDPYIVDGSSASLSFGISAPAIVQGPLPGTPEIVYVEKRTIIKPIIGDKEVVLDRDAIALPGTGNPVGAVSPIGFKRTDLIIGWQPTNLTLPIVSYNVYRGTTPSFSPDSSNLLASTNQPEYTDAGAVSSGNAYYYRITAIDAAAQESDLYGNMAFISTFNLTYTPDKSNLNWISIPYVRPYTKASDLAAAIPNCVKVTRFSPYVQLYENYEYSEQSGWTGIDFSLIPGEAAAVYINANSSFSLIGGHNPSYAMILQHYDTISNVNWVSLPYNTSYKTASDISEELSQNIETVLRYNPEIQDYDTWLKHPSGTWAGTNFAIDPKQGYAIGILNDFSWSPAVITGK